MVPSNHNIQANRTASNQSQLSANDVWHGKQDNMEDIESLLEGLPMPRLNTSSLSDNFDLLPDAKTGLVTVTSSQRLIDMSEQLLHALNLTAIKCDQFLSDMDSNSLRLQALEQKQQEIISIMAKQQIYCQQLQGRQKKEAESSRNDHTPITPPDALISTSEWLEPIEEDSFARAGSADNSPICFLLELYPRPGNGYPGRIHHTLSKQSVSFKGMNFEQILPFIKKYLPQPDESVPVYQPNMMAPAIEQSVEPAEQTTPGIDQQPNQEPEVKYSFIKEIGLIQDRQKTTQPPFRLQASKRFAVVLNLELPISQADALKSNYMLRYDVDFKARHLPDNRIANQSTQHGGMNSKFPKEARAFYLDALAPGNYMLEIRVVVPQNNISEQKQQEIYVV